MDFFQIMADFLHLIAMGILIQRIRSSRNSYGTIKFTIILIHKSLLLHINEPQYRIIIQKSRNIHGSLHTEIPQHLLQICFSLQLAVQNRIPRPHRIYHIFNAICKAFQQRMDFKTQFKFRLRASDILGIRFSIIYCIQWGYHLPFYSITNSHVIVILYDSKQFMELLIASHYGWKLLQ